MSKIGALLAAAVAATTAAGATVWAKRRRDEDELDLEVTEAAAGPARAGEAGVKPSAVATDAADDLTSLKGLGAVTAAKLADIGCTSFTQIAAWSEEDIADVGMKINVSPGRIKREDWVGQAGARLESESG